MESREISIGKWNLKVNVDDGGELNLVITHSDGTEIYRLYDDRATNDGKWANRFTTQGIENHKYKP